MSRQYRLPVDDDVIEFEMEDDVVSFRTTDTSFALKLVDNRLLLIGGPAACEADVTYDAAIRLSQLVPDVQLADQLVRFCVSVSLDIPMASAIEELLKRAAPLLTSVCSGHDLQPASMAPALYRALQKGSMLEAARSFWNDEQTTRSDVPAFERTLGVGTRLMEYRTAFIGLAPAGLRGELAETPSRINLPTHHRCRSVFRGHANRQRTELVRAGLSRPAAPRVLEAASAEGLRLPDGDPGASWRRVEEDLRALGYFRPHGPSDRIVASGVGDHRVRKLDTKKGLAQAGSELGNCLGSNHHGWPRRVATGEVLMFTIEARGDGLIAAFAVDSRSGVLIEARGPRNAPLPTELAEALRSALTKAGWTARRS